MNLIQQHMENVSLELARLEERMVQLKAEQDETRKLLGNIRRYRKSLNKQYPSSQATLPLAPSGDEEEEEATDEPAELESPAESEADVEANAMAQEWESDAPTEIEAAKSHGDYADWARESPSLGRISDEEVIPSKPRRRKAKAVASEEVAGG